MTETRVDQMMTDQMILVEGLYNTVMESDDAETVRGAVAALLNTEVGINYIRFHPLTL